MPVAVFRIKKLCCPPHTVTKLKTSVRGLSGIRRQDSASASNFAPRRDRLPW